MAAVCEVGLQPWTDCESMGPRTRTSTKLCPTSKTEGDTRRLLNNFVPSFSCHFAFLTLTSFRSLRDRRRCQRLKKIKPSFMLEYVSQALKEHLGILQHKSYGTKEPPLYHLSERENRNKRNCLIR